MAHRTMGPVGFMFSALIMGCVFIILGIPLALRKVGPNGIYGFRVNKTFSDPVVWYKANAYAGKAMILSGVVTALLALCIPYLARQFALSSGLLGALGLAVELAPLTLGVVASFIYLSRL